MFCRTRVPFPPHSHSGPHLWRPNDHGHADEHNQGQCHLCGWWSVRCGLRVPWVRTSGKVVLLGVLGPGASRWATPPPPPPSVPLAHNTTPTPLSCHQCLPVFLLLCLFLCLCRPQHPAHFRASFVNINAVHLFNESGLAPPMTHAFTSGVAFCTLVQCGAGHEFEHFHIAAQTLFKLSIHPAAEMVTEGGSLLLSPFLSIEVTVFDSSLPVHDLRTPSSCPPRPHPHALP